MDTHSLVGHLSIQAKPQQQRFIALPVEIRIQILEESQSITSLESLATCCSSYHEAYLSSREAILSRVIRQQTGPWLEDLLLVTEARKLDHREDINATNTNEHVTALLDQYRRGRLSNLTNEAKPEVLFAPETLPLESTISLAQAQRFVVWTQQRMCQNYTSRLRELDESLLIGTSLIDGQSIQPTDLETIRFCRAICRFEAFCIMFAFQAKWYNAEELEAASKSNHLYPQHLIWEHSPDVCDLYFRLFLPWEVEEMACVFEFLEEEYGSIFIDIARHYCKANPKVKINERSTNVGPHDDPFDPFDIRPFSNEFTEGQISEASLGPSHLYDLFRNKSLAPIYKHWRNLFAYPDWTIGARCGIIPYKNVLDEMDDDSNQWYSFWPATDQTNLDDTDGMSCLPDKQPSDGWYWLDQYLENKLNIADGLYHDESSPFTHCDVRTWGYVFWDSERLEELKAYDGETCPTALRPIDFSQGKATVDWGERVEERWKNKAAESAESSGVWDMSIFRFPSS